MPKDEGGRTSENRRKSRGDSDLVPYKRKSPSMHSIRDEGDLMPENEASGSHEMATEMVGVRPGPSDLSLPGSFFQSSRNVHVNGGQFSSSQLHHTNFTININRTYDSVEIGGSAPESYDTSDLVHSDARPSTILHNASRTVNPVSKDSRETEDPSGTHQIPHRRLSLPVQKSSEIYFRHLAAKGRGTPLWIPEPNDMLPIGYQRKGIAIGDVGIITDSGGFDFLFNICLPHDDPINPSEMPEGFKPLKYPEPRDIYGNSEFKANSYLASSLVETSQRDGESPGLVFESSATDGAVLTMPNGSKSRDLRNVTTFRKYASANAEKWYTYANEIRGREARNGDLRLVVGYHKSDAWGMATFSNLSEHSAFRLKFKRTSESNLGGSYGWEYSGMAEVKSGPDVHEIERLRLLGAADQQGGEEEGPVSFENQCLFVRTINITLQDAIWRRLNRNWDLLFLDDSEETQTSTHDQDPQISSDRSSIPDIFSNLASGSSPGAGGSHEHDVVMRGPKDSLDVEFQNGRSSLQPAQLSALPMALDLHPSEVINQCLLKERPNMKMAITEDKDWISVLEPDEKILPTSETIFARIMAIYDICEDEGVVFLQPHEVGLPSTPPPLGERVLKYPESLRESVDSNLLASLSRSFSRSGRTAKLPSSYDSPTAPSPSPFPMLLDLKNPYPTPLPREPFDLENIGPNLSEASRNVLGLHKSEANPVDSQSPVEGSLPVPTSQRSSLPPSTPPPIPDPALAAMQALLDPETAYPTPVAIPFHRRK